MSAMRELVERLQKAEATVERLTGIHSDAEHDLAELISRHYPSAYIGNISGEPSHHVYYCQCGQWEGSAREHAVHVASVLSAAFAIVPASGVVL